MGWFRKADPERIHQCRWSHQCAGDPVRKLRGFGQRANRRASMGCLSNNLIFYLVSGNDAYVVQNDPA